jgi:hypothetical protein
MSEIPAAGALLLILLVVVMLWFALGTQRNIRRGNETLRWLQGGLPLLGKRTTMRWLGSSAVVLRIQEAREPFREAEVVLALQPRDVPLLWMASRRRGRRDFLVLRGTLQSAPRFEMEAGDSRGWTGEDRLKRLDTEEWQEARWQEDHVRAFTSGNADPSAARGAWDSLAAASGGLWRLSIRREHPHLEAHVLPPDPGASARELIEVFRNVGRSVMREK